MALRETIGNRAVIEALLRALAADTLPQSLLFVGPEGVGKATVARSLAAAAGCTARTGGDACGTCAHCRRIAADQHPDFVRIAPDGDTTKIWQLWSRSGHPDGALETLPFAPVAAKQRFYVIERAETMNEESANSLLKALEEPPSYVRFILCAPSQDAVLPTVRSRCRLVRFQRATAGEIRRALETRHAVESGTAERWSALAEGAPGRALRWVAAPEGLEARERIVALAVALSVGPPIVALRLAETLRSSGGRKRAGAEGDAEEGSTRGELARSIEWLGMWYADLLRLAMGGPGVALVHESWRSEAEAAARRYTPEALRDCVADCLSFRHHVARNANVALASEVLLMRLAGRAES
ncbi:MAG: ATP-binding protein [Armatimonadota bacterium]